MKHISILFLRLFNPFPALWVALFTFVFFNSGIVVWAQKDTTFTVSRGNTLYSIARQFDVSVSDLQKWNNLPTETIYRGQVLRITLPLSPLHIEKDTLSKPSLTSEDTNAKLLHQPLLRKLTKEMSTYGLQVAALEQKYDRYLHSVLSQYLVPKSYLVDVRVELEPIKANVSKPNPATQVVFDIDLPGMPFIPEDLLRRDMFTEPSSSGFSVFYSKLQLQRLVILVYVDTMYSAQEIAFVQQLVQSVAKIEPQRGDKIQILPQVFPSKPQISNAQELELTASNEMPTQKHSLIFNSLPGLILVVSVVILIIAIVLLLVLRKKK
ncbi:MAG: LysM peptidoglycan-binding domain-containing protein [Bacteroidales bacterium]|nr:LysM peptidoglycan-binding domain-containing protein [Bacteroidales bacterium]MDZ4205323.1 LysM peptidoglycan-binding domain-containing protein [Bacteroidales bacterium]